MTAFDLMTQKDAENHIKTADPSAYVEFATGRIFGTYKGHDILLAGNSDWKQALDNLGSKIPVYHAWPFCVWTFEN